MEEGFVQTGQVGAGAFVVEGELFDLGQGFEAMPSGLDELRQIDGFEGEPLPGAPLQAAEVEQILHQVAEANGFVNQAIQPDLEGGIDAGLKGLGHQTDGGERGFEFVGHVGGPAITLLHQQFRLLPIF